MAAKKYSYPQFVGVWAVFTTKWLLVGPCSLAKMFKNSCIISSKNAGRQPRTLGLEFLQTQNF